MKYVTIVPFALAVVACGGAQDEDIAQGDQNVEVIAGETASGLCSAQITAAAITKQIVEVNEETDAATLTVELVTISNTPYQMLNGYLSTKPAGFGLPTASSSYCFLMTSGSYKCRSKVTIPALGACTGTGNYVMSFQAVPDAGSGCGYSSGQVAFSLTTENFCSAYTVNVTPATLYTAWQYGGTAQPLGEGWFNLAGSLDNAVSSLRVAPGYRVWLFENANAGGDYRWYDSDISWVGDAWNDRTSSVFVERLP